MTDAVLDIVKAKGPVLPIQISKETKIDTIFAAAKLSELVQYKKIKISHVKIGGSPVYYVDGQEEKLQGRLYNYMNEGEKKAFDLLKKRRVLKDFDQNAEIKKSLKTLKDFAKPLNVKANGNSLLFWKWHLAEDEEIKAIINELLHEPKEEVVKEPEEVQKSDVITDEIKTEEPEVKKEIIKEIQKVEEITEASVDIEKPVEVAETTQTKIVSEVPIEEKEDPEEDVDISYSSDEVSIAFQPSQSMQAPLAKNAATKLEEPDDEFYKEVKSFLDPQGVDIIEVKLIKKNSEIDLIIDLPTTLGAARYFCRAKNKKRISDGDLSTAFVQGQIRRLPVILLSPGELSKKALDMVNQELRGQILFKCMNNEV